MYYRFRRQYVNEIFAKRKRHHRPLRVLAGLILLSRLGFSLTVDDLCLKCRSASESVHHLFSCASHPTNLTVVDLWKRPWEVVCHLTSFPSFNFLPHPGPPPPPPVRRRCRPPIPPDPPVSPDRQDRPDSPGLLVNTTFFSPLSLPPATPPLVNIATPHLVNSFPLIPPLMRPQAPRYARSSRSSSINSSDNDTQESADTTL